MDKITLAFITHNRINELTKYINSIISKIPKEIKVILIYDNKKEENKTLDPRVKFFSWNNIGKLKSILRVSESVETNYLKIIDHDDCIDYRNLKKLVSLLPEDKDSFVYHKASKIFNTSKLFGKITSEDNELDILKNESVDVNWNKIPNAQSIYNVDVLREMQKINHKITRQKFFNDDLLALACQYRKKKIIKLDIEFYFQYHSFGQTAKINDDKIISQYELFLNLNTFFNEYKLIKKESYSSEKKLKSSIEHQCSLMDKCSSLTKKYCNLAKKELYNLMRNNKLTLLITIHNDFDAVDFFINLLKKTKNKVVFAFDTNKINKKIISKIEENGYDFFINKENTGKFNLILNSIDKVNTRFFKIIDQDDSISMRHLSKFNNKLNSINKECIIKHKAFKVTKESNATTRSIDKKVIKKQVKKSIDVQYKQQTNCDTVYFTDTIRKLKETKLKITRQDFHNDVLLSNFVVGLGINLIKIDEGFYIQFHEKGQTSKLNIKRSECIKELYLNYKLFTKHFEDFNIKNMKDGKIQSHINFIKRFTLDYLSGVDPSLGEKLYTDTIEILEELWMSEA